jgi:hypothetical protein
MNKKFLVMEIDGEIVIHGYDNDSGQHFYSQPFNPFTGKKFSDLEEGRAFVKKEFGFSTQTDIEDGEYIVVFHKEAPVEEIPPES